MRLTSISHFYSFYVIILCGSYFACLVQGTDFSSYLYESDNVCGISERISRGCISLASSSRMSPTQCAVMCQSHLSFCHSLIMNDVGKCYFFQDCDLDQGSLTCLPEDSTYFLYRLTSLTLQAGSCVNNAVYNSMTDTCDCPDYWLGQHCHLRPQTCRELRAKGFPLGDHVVDMNLLGQTHTTRVKCKLGPDYVRTYVSVSNGHGDFNQTFTRYRSGFFHGEDAFWIGLDNMRALNGAGLDKLVLSTQISGEEMRTTYSGVSVGTPSTDYEINYSHIILNGNTFHINVEECIPKNVRFSTWDRDNDAEPSRNIPAETGSGWWYVDSDVMGYFCNPNGKAPTPSSPEEELEYISIRGINLTYSGMGQFFENESFYFQEDYP